MLQPESNAAVPPGVPQGTPPSPWTVLVVEEINQPAAGRKISLVQQARDQEDARNIAADIAHRYAPGRPWNQQQRYVFRATPDRWLVQIVGATTRAHYEVVVVELMARMDMMGYPIPL